VALFKGEAHFNVAKDVTRPFIVIANGGLIRAVGTAFNVQVLEDANVEVTVTEGVVEVLRDANASATNFGESGDRMITPTRITRNHKIQYDPQRIATGDVAALPVEKIERELAWRHGMLSFDGQSLDIVIQEVSRYTNVEFEFARDDLREVQVGGYFKATDTDALLELLRSALDIKSQRIGNKVLIYKSETKSGDFRPVEVDSL
jgi:transmembrane sensor